MSIHLSRQNKGISMRISNKVFEMVLTDRELRLKVALSLGMTEDGVRKSCLNKRDTLTKKAALVAITSHTGLTEDQILETATA